MSTARPTTAGEILRKALQEGLLGDDEPAALFIDLDRYESQLDELVTACPSATPQLALRSAPLPSLVLSADKRGFQFTVQDSTESELAVHLDLADRVVRRGSGRTEAEVKRAIAGGWWLDIDHWGDLVRFAGMAPPGRVALQLDGQGGPGLRPGIPIADVRIQGAWEAWSWIEGLRVDLGDAPIGVDALADAVARTVRLADALGKVRPVQRITIALGIPASPPGEPPATFARSIAAIRRSAPRLFVGPWKIVLEIGAAAVNRCTFAALRVLSTRPDAKAVLIPLGSRLCSGPGVQVTALDARGAAKRPGADAWAAVGPRCTADDVIGREKVLADASAGDFVIAVDVGSSLLASLADPALPAVYGWRKGELVELRPRVSADEVLATWGWGAD